MYLQCKMIRPFQFIEIFAGTILFMMLLLVIVSDDFKSDMKTFMYFLVIVMATVGIQFILFYDEDTTFYLDTETGVLVKEEGI